MTRRLLSFALALFAIVSTSGAGLAAAADDACWAPDRSQAPDPAVAKAAPIAALNADVTRVADILKRNASLARIQGVRLMVTSYIGYQYPGIGHATRISAGLYPPNTWRDGCTLMKGPEFFNLGHVHVSFNSPDALFDDVGVVFKDDVLTAYKEPTATVQAGEETYFENLRAVVLTPGGIPAFVPVTNEDWSGVRERKALKTIEDVKGELGRAAASMQDYRSWMTRNIERESDPARAAQARATMEDNIKSMMSANAAQSAALTARQAEAEDRLRAIRDERNRLSDSERQAPARVDGVTLIKFNPAMKTVGARHHVRMIVVKATANDKTLFPALKQAVLEMDYPALKALLK